MKHVVVKGTDSGYYLDPQPYLSELENLAPHLPPGAREFAEMPDHYDFYSLRCVKDLRFASLLVDDTTETTTLTLAPYQFKHDEALTIQYSNVQSLVMEHDDTRDITWLGSVMLDEVLPADASSMSHEVVFTSGRLHIVASDLTARWHQPE